MQAHAEALDVAHGAHGAQVCVCVCVCVCVWQSSPGLLYYERSFIRTPCCKFAKKSSRKRL
jgi:hypothetical protein